MDMDETVQSAGAEGVSDGSDGVVDYLVRELTSPVNVLLICGCLYIVYKLWVRQREESAPPAPREPPLPPLARQDFTLQQLSFYDGTEKCGGRVLVAVNHQVFDVTRGKKFYGPGGPYAAFAGRDASRGLATFSVQGGDQYDDLSDLTPLQMESVREWQEQFTDRYVYVGKLLKPGEKPTDYTDEEGDESRPATESASASASDTTPGDKKED